MTKEEIIEKVKKLNMPHGSYVVFGSCPMAAAGLREANDIDMLVNVEQFESFRKAGWQTVNKGPKDKPLARDVFEAHFKWDFSTYQPTLDELLTRSTDFEGVPFAALEDVRKWKAASGRPKDREDVRLIDSYLEARRP